MAHSNVMKLAWLNALTASAWHNTNNPIVYFARSLKMAHNGDNLRTQLYGQLAFAGMVAFGLGVGLGHLGALYIG